MKELAAYLLLVLGGKAQPTGDEVKAVLNRVGVEASDEDLTRMLEAVEGKVRV
jgi:large subunit ribosomal protein LP2